MADNQRIISLIPGRSPYERVVRRITGEPLPRRPSPCLRLGLPFATQMDLTRLSPGEVEQDAYAELFQREQLLKSWTDLSSTDQLLNDTDRIMDIGELINFTDAFKGGDFPFAAPVPRP